MRKLSEPRFGLIGLIKKIFFLFNSLNMQSVYPLPGGRQTVTHSASEQGWIITSYITNHPSSFVFVFLSPYDD